MSRLRSVVRVAKPAAMVGLVAAALWGSTTLAQQLSSPSVTAQETTRIISRMLPQMHLNQPQLDDDYSRKLLDLYLEALDPTKRYLTRDDVARFRQYETVLDDSLKAGNPSFALDVFSTWKQRVAERNAQAVKLAQQSFDFTKDEELITDPDLLEWATAAELDDRWRRSIKARILQARLDAEENADDETAFLRGSDSTTGNLADDAERIERKRLVRRYTNEARETAKKGESDALELFLTAAGNVFDPHTTYMSPKTLEEFQSTMKLSLEGIGAALRSIRGYTKVVQIVEDGAAAADGRLKEGDFILAVGDDPENMEDIVEVRLDQVVRKIRGPKGTTVWLKVRSGDGGDVRTIDLVRRKIEMEDAHVKSKIIDLQDAIGRPGRIGVISLPSFYRDFDAANSGAASFQSAGRDVATALESFRQDGKIDAIIVDVRTNGGGSLTEAIDITGMFINQGPVVQVRRSDGGVETLDDNEAGVLTTLPLVVATNRFSASASEIFAGAIKDYRRGIVVGDQTTHGKGTVQNLLPVKRGMFNFGAPNRGVLKLTIQQFYRVNGDSTQTRGVPSDIALPSMLDVIDSGEEFLDNALPFHQIRNASFSPYSYVNSALIGQLRSKSKARVEADEEFGDIEERVDRFLEVKNKTSVSLNEAVRLAELEELKDETKDEDETDDNDIDRKDIFPTDNVYNRELLHIAADYVMALPRTQTAASSR